MKANRKFVNGEEAVSAVIGVILMVAITVAIAATVYMYVSGMIGGGPGSTPSVSVTSEASGTGCIITIGTPTSATIEWKDVWFSCSNLTGQKELKNVVDLTMTWPTRSAGNYLKGGQAIYITNGLNSNPAIKCEYRFTLVYNTTGGTMGSVKWSQ